MKLKMPDDVRLEIKFVAEETEKARVLSWIRTHPLGFRSAFPDRRVNNVYFDSYDYSAYGANLAGISGRIKLRYRWYGDSEGPSAGTLELKCKRNQFGWKERYPAKEAPWQAGDRWADVRSKLAMQVGAGGRSWLAEFPAPTLLNRYDRCYFLSRDRKLRLTVDWNQAGWDQRLASSPNFTRRLNQPSTLVVEAKFAKQDRELASRNLRGIPIRVGRNSKYVNGLQTAGGL